MASQLVANTKKNPPRTHGQHRHRENWQIDVVKLLQEKLLECEQAYAKTKLLLDYYWLKSVKAAGMATHLGQQLNRKELEKTSLEQKLIDVTSQNDRLHSILGQMHDLVLRKSDRENVANAEVQRKDEKLQALRNDIEILRSEKKSIVNSHSKCTVEIQRKADQIIEYERELRCALSERRLLKRKLEEKRQCERKLNRTIRENIQTIDKLTFGIDVHAADSIRQTKVKDDQILKLEGDLKRLQGLYNQLLIGSQKKSSYLEKARLNIDTDLAEVNMEESVSMGSVGRDKIRKKRRASRVGNGNEFVENGSTCIPLIDLTSDEHVNVEG